MTKKSKYETSKIKGWDDSEGFLTKEQTRLLIEDEKNMAEQEAIPAFFTDEFLDYVYEHSAIIKISDENKKAKVFPDNEKPE